MRKFISDLRKKKHISMQKLANTLYISESTVRKVEAGTRNPSPAVAKRWAVYLGIPESKIFKYFFDEGTDFCSKMSESTGGRPAVDHL